MAVSKKKAPARSGGDKAKAYKDIIARFQSEGLGRLYLLYGEESYLIDSFAALIRQEAIGEEDGDFNLHRLEGDPGFAAIREAMDAMPFMSEHTLVELWNADVNRFNDDAFRALFADVPPWCTVVIRQATGVAPKGTLGIVKQIKKDGFAEQFSAQSESSLYGWIQKRFAADGHRIGREAMDTLCFLSGKLMTGLIPEIEKISAAVSAQEITVADVERYAHHIPEARAFEMTNAMADGNMNRAVSLMAELLQSGEEPIMITALLGSQYRSLYAAKVFQANRKERDRDLFKEVTGKSGYGANVTFETAKKFSLEELRQDVRLCARTDRLLKSDNTIGEEERMAELLIRLTMHGKTLR